MSYRFSSYTRAILLFNMAKVAKHLLHTQAKFSQYRARLQCLDFMAFFKQKWGGGYLTIGVNIKILPNLDSVAFFKQNWGCLKIGVNIKILPNLDSMAFFTQKMKGCLIIGVNNKILPSLDSIPFFTKKLGVCLAFFIHRKGRVLDIWCEL